MSAATKACQGNQLYVEILFVIKLRCWFQGTHLQLQVIVAISVHIVHAYFKLFNTHPYPSMSASLPPFDCMKGGGCTCVRVQASTESPCNIRERKQNACEYLGAPQMNRQAVLSPAAPPLTAP